MNRNKILSMALLDLCAFNVTSGSKKYRGEALKAFKEALKLAHQLSLPNLTVYDELIK